MHNMFSKGIKLMDVSSPLRNAKTQKISEEGNINEVRKSIENLPNAVLQHIVSFLPTKDAVRTSILSKRWEYLWISISNLDFDEGKTDKRALFMKFVGRVFELHDSTNIRRFSLSCNVLSDASRINAWVYVALRHKVQGLDLHLKKFQETFVLPNCLFTCESLTALRLEMNHDLKLPSLICFSSLKSLTLIRVIFPDDHSTQQLFSGCPVVEDLHISDCSWKNVKAVCISAPMLKELFIGEDNVEDIDDLDSDTNDQNEDADDQTNSNGCQVLIFGRSLKSFSFSGVLRNDYCLCDSSSLVNASFEVDGERWEFTSEMAREDAYRVYKLLRALSGVESLTLSYETVSALTYAEEFYAHLPVFSNLTCLQFSSPIDIACGAVLRMLQNLPCLNSLKFSRDICLMCDDKDWKLDPVPPCFLTHLKCIKIDLFKGAEDELCAVKVLLEHAAVLQRIVISCTVLTFDLVNDDYKVNVDLKKSEKIQKQLLQLPRKSTSCEMVFW